MTPTVLVRRSLWIVGALIVVTVGGLILLEQLTARSSAVHASTAARLVDRRREVLARSLNPTNQTALLATIPTEPALALVYPSLESLAARHGVTLQYDFTDTPEKDPALVQAETAKDSWVIPVDFLGTRAALEQILTELEIGPYLLKLHAYRFDVTESTESVLSTTLILYGR